MPTNYKRKAPGVQAGNYKRQKVRQGFVRRFAAAGAQPYRPQVYGRTSAPEIKGMDTSISVAGPVVATTNTNADAIVLNLVQQGSGSWNRVGRKIRMKSLRLRGVAGYRFEEQAVSGNIDASTMRMVVVYDHQPNGATIPTFDTVFGLTDQTGAETSSVNAPVRYDNMSRFKVLKDKTFQAKPGVISTFGGTNDAVENQYPFDEYMDLKGLETVFSGQSNPMTIADLGTGALYVYFRATNSSADVTDWRVIGTPFARLRYFD